MALLIPDKSSLVLLKNQKAEGYHLGPVPPSAADPAPLCWVMMLVYWLAESAMDREVLSSIPALTKHFSRDPAILEFVRCQHIQEKDDKN